MTNSGDAAEQIVRISLEGVDYAIRITGSAAKNIAAFLLAAWGSDGTDGKLKLKGKERLVNMLKSGKDTKIFSIKNSDLKQFYIEAKRYGVTYCVLKDRRDAPDSMVEIMVTENDAGKISRIMDRLEFAAVEVAALETAPAEREALDRDETEKLLDELLGGEDGKTNAETLEANKAEKAAEKGQTENPTRAGVEKEHPSEPRSGTPSPSAEDTRATKKPESVKEFLRERTQAAAKKRQDRNLDRAEPDAKKPPQKTPKHQQPQRAAKKNKSRKER